MTVYFNPSDAHPHDQKGYCILRNNGAVTRVGFVLESALCSFPWPEFHRVAMTWGAYCEMLA